MINYEIVDVTLNKLYEIMTDPESKNADKISAAKAILEIYSLKTHIQNPK